MPLLYLPFADIVIFNLQVQQLHIFITISQVICWTLALAIGLLTRIILGRRMPFGIIGTTLMALLGIWAAKDVLLLGIPGDIALFDVPLLKASIGALVMEVLWYLIALRSYQIWSKRRKRRTSSLA